MADVLVKEAAKTPAEIESDIRHTRARMGADIEAIGAKLNPARLKRRAKMMLGMLALGAVIRAALRRWA
jgi:hypothetical protein